MAVQARQLYRSSNGDRWSLAQRPGDARVYVRHEANLSSGGEKRDIEVGDFLTRGGNGPEKQELIRLIAGLITTSET
jgi:hypothetical protein